MTAFTFLHAADLHLGSPLAGLALKDAQVAARFAAASRDSFSALASRAIEEKVAFVVIAGDVYDGEWKDASIGLFFNREVARLDRAGIPLFLLKGNHDAESVVTKSISLPTSVRQFSTKEPETFRLDELRVALHGRSFADRAVTENLAISYPAPTPGWFNIGVLHTSCDGRPPHANYAPCTMQDLQLRGYDYWALGHVHEHEVLSREPWIVFPGNLQGRSVRECGPKGAVLVSVQDGHVKSVERLIVDHARWAQVSVDLSDIQDETAALSRIEAAIAPGAAEAEGRLMALRVHLTGESPLHARLNADPRRFADEVQAAAQRQHADIWLERLRIKTRDPIDSVEGDALASLDLHATLNDLDGETELRGRAKELIAGILAKMPGGMSHDEPALSDDLDDLLAEAKALVLGRALNAVSN